MFFRKNLTKKKKIIGYALGSFDLFHIGHLHILKRAKSLCDKLIVGIATDELITNYKGKEPIIPFHERLEIIQNIKCVDLTLPQETLDSFKDWEKLKYDIIFVGDDWYQSPRFNKLEERFRNKGVKVIYLPYTQAISSTSIKEKIKGN
tara:strand:- start:474 stop:917 length:444 start_codon:yes stop_codon:yes gene_type:complete